MRTCSVDGCERVHRCVGFCGMHYQRFLATGDPRADLPPRVPHAHATGGKTSPTYVSWRAMVARCTRPANTDWTYYGGRGIKVCDRWLTFANFLADMGERPNGLTIDRIDPDGDYEPDNCRWASRRDQNRNQRRHKAVAP